jgi:hypothetical protein
MLINIISFFGQNGCVVRYVVGQLELQPSLGSFRLIQIRVSLHELNHHHLHLGHSQVLADATAGPSAEIQRNILEVLFCFLLLPTLRYKLQRIVENLRVVEHSNPYRNNTSTLLEKNPTKSRILNEFSFKQAICREVHPRDLIDNALQIDQFFYIFVCDVFVSLDHSIDLISQSLNHGWFLKDVEKHTSEKIGSRLRSCNDKSFDLGDQLTYVSINTFAFLVL